LPRTVISDKPFEPAQVDQLMQKTMTLYQLETDETRYFVKTGTIANSAYNQENDKILIKEKDETVTEIVNVADMLNIRALSGTISKYYLSFPKEINLDQ
jgi:uncharacterized protein